MDTSMDSIRWSVAEEPWPWKGMGNHRVLMTVEQAAPAVLARIPWRRRDVKPEGIGVRIFDLKTNQEVLNVHPLKITRESGEIVFEAAAAGHYALYYLPFEIAGKAFFAPHVVARAADYGQADPAWVSKVRDSVTFPVASVQEIQARTVQDSFYPMEVIASEDEKQAVLARHAGKGFLLFPEDRERPIRMTEDLPAHWMKSGPSDHFSAVVRPNEYFVFQIGLFAVQQAIDIQVEFTDLRATEEKTIRSASLTCFNSGDRDWLGRFFARTIDVQAGVLQPLWFGIDVPPTAAGDYSGTVTIHPRGLPPQSVTLHLSCQGDLLPDRGDSELWKHARLRWLNSSMGLDTETAAGYSAVRLNGTEVAIQGRQFNLGPCGLPDRICSFFAPSVDRLQDSPTDILTRPMGLAISTVDGPMTWTSRGLTLNQQGAGAVIVEASSQAPGLALETRGRIEFDGHMDCRMILTATSDCDLTGMALEIPMQRDVAVYMMGMGRKGGFRPALWQYEWNRDCSNHHCWVGTVNAGLHLKLKHDDDVWDLVNLHSSGFPAGWYNNGLGGCEFVEQGNEVLIRAFCGPRKLKAGEKVSLRFSLITTPLKLLDLKAHWQQRYHHIDCWDGRCPSVEEAKCAGATVVNLHQGGKLNPYINYPFHFMREMKAETEAAHAAGLKYKLYYTLRELTHMTTEIWAFRSLNGEIYQEEGEAVIADQFAEREQRDDISGGTGGPWLREHLMGRYVPAWHQPLPSGEMDQAIATTGLSRLHNYYIEGVAWLIRELGLDGLYLDGVGYDREILKRVRKAMDRARPGCLIDLHAGNTFHPAYGMNNVLSLYMELLPYVDSLWIGEGFDYGESPDYYLTEICGIPFGLTNDMLQGGGNPWRGMIYGMTCRYGWQQGGDPQHLWRLWKMFGIEDAQMVGYWCPDCVVTTDHLKVLATAYVRPDGKALIALASWATEDVTCHLAFDWKRLGGERQEVKLTAPEIPGFQAEGCFDVEAGLLVNPGRGWLLLLDTAQAKNAQ